MERCITPERERDGPVEAQRQREMKGGTVMWSQMLLISCVAVRASSL